MAQKFAERVTSFAIFVWGERKRKVPSQNIDLLIGKAAVDHRRYDRDHAPFPMSELRELLLQKIYLQIPHLPLFEHVI